MKKEYYKDVAVNVLVYGGILFVVIKLWEVAIRTIIKMINAV